MDVKRLFIAVEISEETRALVGDHIKTLRAAHANVRVGWTAPEKLHITVKFLGDVEISRIDSLRSAIGHAAEGLEPFALQIAGTGLFPSKRRPSVLWLGISDPDNGLDRLYSRVEDACEDAGFARESRAFRPHLTIARIREPQNAGHLAAAHLETSFAGETFKVKQISLIQSTLSRSGSDYEHVHDVQLRSAA